MEFVEHNQMELRALEGEQKVAQAVYTEKQAQAEEARKELNRIEKRIGAVKETIATYSESDPFCYRNVRAAPLEIK